MKKLLISICLLALISFAGSAFAASAGHINTGAEVNRTPVVTYAPDPGLTASGGTVVVITANASTPTGFSAANIYLPKETINQVAVMTNGHISVTDLVPGQPLKISLPNYTDTRTTDLYAFIMANKTSDGYTKGMFHAFPCTVTNQVLSFTVDKPEVFFSENTVVLATAKTVTTDDGSGSSGGGGCNAGYAGLLLLAAVPFFFRKKK